MNFGIFLFFAAALLDPFIDTMLKEELSQRFGMKEFRLTVVLVFKFKIKILKQLFSIADDHIVHGHLSRLAVADNCHIDRDGNCTIRIHIQRLESLFRIGSAHGHHTDLHIFSSVIVDA